MKKIMLISIGLLTGFAALADGPLTPDQPISQPVRGFQPAGDLSQMVGDQTQTYSQQELILVQQALCVPASEVGTYGSYTRDLIKVAQDMLFHDLSSTDLSGKLTNRQRDQVLSVGAIPCDTTLYRNIFEERSFSGPNLEVNLEGFIDLINHVAIGGTLPENASLADARPKIKAMNTAFGLAYETPELADQVTASFIADVKAWIRSGK